MNLPARLGAFRELSGGLPDSGRRSWCDGRMSEEAVEQPSLPVWKAFVVQFERLAGGAAGTFAGRVEHLSSGRRAHFASGDELVVVLGTLLEQASGESD